LIFDLIGYLLEPILVGTFLLESKAACSLILNGKVVVNET
jgi:hypothetical protein